MASTYSPDLRLELMGTGDQSGTWGDTTNTNLGTLLEQAICGVLSVAEGDTTLTLTANNGATDQARNAVINLTGAMTGARNVVVPTANKLYLIKNSTTGGFAVTVKTAAGTGVAVPATTARWVYCDATNVVDAISGPWTPTTNDAAALGLATISWSDLFLASGGVLNWANGDAAITHSIGVLTVSTGDLRVTTAGTNSASAVTVGGTQTLTNKTLTSPSLTTPSLGVATATSINKVTITAPATSATLTVADGKTLTASNTLTLSGTDAKALVLTAGLTVAGNDGTINFGASGKTLKVDNTLELAGTDGTTMTFPGTSSTVVTTGNTALITKGYTVTPNNLGTISSGTTTPAASNGNYQYYTNNGAHTLAAPAADSAIDILVTNGASAGTITFSGFTVGSSTGSALTTTNTSKFIISIRRINSISTYSCYALQ